MMRAFLDPGDLLVYGNGFSRLWADIKKKQRRVGWGRVRRRIGMKKGSVASKINHQES